MAVNLVLVGTGRLPDEECEGMKPLREGGFEKCKEPVEATWLVDGTPRKVCGTHHYGLSNTKALQDADTDAAE